MRSIGAMLVIFAGTAGGWIYGSLLRKRHKILSELRLFFQWLKTEISYGSVPLSAAFEKIGRRLEGGSLSEMVFHFIDRLSSPEGLTADEAWQRSLTDSREELPLNGEDWENLRDFGRTLGNTDRDHQVKAIEDTIERLKLRETEAWRMVEKNEKIYRYLGMAIGVLVVLLFY